MKHTKENSVDKGEKVKKRIRIPDHRFQKGKTISKNINHCLLFIAVERTKDKRKFKKELKKNSDEDELNDLKITKKNSIEDKINDESNVIKQKNSRFYLF